MSVVIFNSLEARNRLVEVGIPEKHAEAYVQVLAEVASLDINQIATKDYIDARFTRIESLLREK